MKRYPDCIEIKLGQNYRSTPEIISVAEKLIKHNSTYRQINYTTDNPSGPPVKCFSYHDATEEARCIASQIKEFVNDYGWNFSDIIILYRVNSLALELQTTFVNEGIPYVTIGGPSIWDKREMRDAISMLRFAVNKKDELAFARIAKLFPGVGDTTVAIIEKIAKDNNLNIFECCQKIETFSNKSVVKKAANKIVEIFSFDINKYHAGNALAYLVEKTGYYEKLRLAYSEDFQDRISNVEELIVNATDFGQKNKSIEKYLQNISLITSSDKENGEDKVMLETIHAAKGTEAPIVFICGVEQGLLPHALSLADTEDTEDGLESERRVFFVSITRAKKQLIISYTQNRKYRDNRGFLRYKPTKPSPFLYEAELL